MVSLQQDKKNQEDRFANNQGVINGRMITFFMADEISKMQEYAKTLTEEQRRAARLHVKIYKTLKKK